MSVPDEIIDAIAAAVEAQGGTLEDAIDLVDVWERLDGDRGGRNARLRYEAANPACSCADGGEGDAERCARCHGLIGRKARR